MSMEHAAQKAATSRAINELRAIVGPDGLLTDPNELVVYECDGFPIAKGWPRAAVFPTTTQQVADCVKVLARHRLSIVPRGSGTGLTGGSVVFDAGVLLVTTRMTMIESIDLDNRVAVVQAGVLNKSLSQAVVKLEQDRQRAKRDNAPAPRTSLRFAPDPSSQASSTIGGNAATNAGGINTLKYGVTTQHILGLEMVLPDGSIVATRTAPLHDGVGPDLSALVCGSEGTLGIITRLWCRLTPAPRYFRTIYALFASSDDACQTVSDVIAAGIVPCSMEMLDGGMLGVVRQAFNFELPENAAALLLVEIDGLDDDLDDEMRTILQICRTHGLIEARHCADETQRTALWSLRKRAFGAIGRISRSYCTQDACIPRSKLAEALRTFADLGRQYDMRISNVFHAGDGNVHPILLFDEDNPDDVRKTMQISEKILEYCISIGGTITGEHGVGIEKLHLMDKMFTPPTMDVFRRIKETFDPRRRINDGKLIPSEKPVVQLDHPLTPNIPGGAL